MSEASLLGSGMFSTSKLPGPMDWEARSNTGQALYVIGLLCFVDFPYGRTNSGGAWSLHTPADGLRKHLISSAPA